MHLSSPRQNFHQSPNASQIILDPSLKGVTSPFGSFIIRMNFVYIKRRYEIDKIRSLYPLLKITLER
jgi:hypothetical protein